MNHGRGLGGEHGSAQHQQQHDNLKEKTGPKVYPQADHGAIISGDRSQITSPTVKEVAAGFRTPSPETGIVLWWGMDGPVNEAVVNRDLDTFKRLGFTSVISKAALGRLRAFAKSGGKVVFLGQSPSLVIETSFLKAGQAGDLSWAVFEPAVELTPKVIAALPPPDVAFDQPATAVKYVHRRWRDADLYFFHNESDQPQARKAVLAGSGKVEVWDPAAVAVSPLAGASAAKGRVAVPLELKPWGSRFIVIGTPAPKL